MTATVGVAVGVASIHAGDSMSSVHTVHSVDAVDAVDALGVVVSTESGTTPRPVVDEGGPALDMGALTCRARRPAHIVIARDTESASVSTLTKQGSSLVVRNATSHTHTSRAASGAVSSKMKGKTTTSITSLAVEGTTQQSNAPALIGFNYG